MDFNELLERDHTEKWSSEVRSSDLPSREPMVVEDPFTCIFAHSCSGTLTIAYP